VPLIKLEPSPGSLYVLDLYQPPSTEYKPRIYLQWDNNTFRAILCFELSKVLCTGDRLLRVFVICFQPVTKIAVSVAGKLWRTYLYGNNGSSVGNLILHGHVNDSINVILPRCFNVCSVRPEFRSGKTSGPQCETSGCGFRVDLE
jgi:hypothetical protein